MGDVWVGHILQNLSATEGSSGETSQVTTFVIQCLHLAFPPPGEKGDSVTSVTHFSVGDSTKAEDTTIRQKVDSPSNMSEDQTVNQG